MTAAAATTIITATTMAMVPQRMIRPRKRTDFILI